MRQGVSVNGSNYLERFTCREPIILREGIVRGTINLIGPGDFFYTPVNNKLRSFPSAF